MYIKIIAYRWGEIKYHDRIEECGPRNVHHQATRHQPQLSQGSIFEVDPNPNGP